MEEEQERKNGKKKGKWGEEGEMRRKNMRRRIIMSRRGTRIKLFMEWLILNKSLEFYYKSIFNIFF